MSTVHHLCPFLLLSFFLPALLYLFLFLSFHLCHSYTDPLRESVRQGAGTKSQSSTIWKIEQERRAERGGREGRGGERARKREKDAYTHTHTHVCRRFRFSRSVNIRGRGVPEIGVRHEIEGSVASNMLGRINEVVARRRLRK